MLKAVFWPQDQVSLLLGFREALEGTGTQSQVGSVQSKHPSYCAVSVACEASGDFCPRNTADRLKRLDQTLLASQKLMFLLLDS